MFKFVQSEPFLHDSHLFFCFCLFWYKSASFVKCIQVPPKLAEYARFTINQQIFVYSRNNNHERSIWYRIPRGIEFEGHPKCCGECYCLDVHVNLFQIPTQARFLSNQMRYCSVVRNGYVPQDPDAHSQDQINWDSATVLVPFCKAVGPSSQNRYIF